jgi:hypothetical protein
VLHIVLIGITIVPVSLAQLLEQCIIYARFEVRTSDTTKKIRDTIEKLKKKIHLKLHIDK